MKNKFCKIISLLIVFCTCISVLAVTTSALSWDGSSAGGAGKGKPADVNGFAVRRHPGDNTLGYRFSVVDKTGATKTGVIDVFLNDYYGNLEYSSAYKFSGKYNKKQLIGYQNSGFSTSKTSVNCYKEADMGFATALGIPSTMKTWQANNNNLNKILAKLSIGSISALKNGDKILVEPIFDVKIEGTYHAVTVTELALYGKHYLGVNSDGGYSSTASSWGFIAKCSNKVYPNSLYTPNGQGLWTAATELTSQATFYKIINYGYGVGIAYTETKSDFSPNLTVQLCEVWKGTVANRGAVLGTTSGNSFSKYTYMNGYPKAGLSVNYAVRFAKESENCYVRQTVWIDNVQQTYADRYSNEGSLSYTYVAFNGAESIPTNKSYYKVKARMDWINSSGTVLKYGTEKIFYIPVQPTVYRYQVSAINYCGEVQAYNGSGGSSGKVYVGQRVYTRYQYTAANTWTSYNNLYAAMNKWSGSEWVSVSSTGVDAEATQKALSDTKSQTLNSSLGNIRVPNNKGSGSNIMKFKLRTQWYSDTKNTEETTWINIPVSVADVELYDIYLVDENGQKINQLKLDVGDTVYVRHQYKNNTDCTVFVEGYKNDGSQISGVYKIEAGGIITVDAGSYVVPDKRDFTIWGGVYLEGAGIRKTSWESDGTNNSAALVCKTKYPLTLTPITPNASYRAGTTVITSYYLNNKSEINYCTASDLKVRFRVYNSEGDTQLYSETQNVVVPAHDKNLVYFKWEVPSDIGSAGVLIYADILDDGVYYNLVSDKRSTTSYSYYTTPDTAYEDEAPSTFSKPSTPSASTGYTTWEIYTCSGTTFTKSSYGIGISQSCTNTAAPATGETATKSGTKWTMKSGYGVSLTVKSAVANVSGYSLPSSASYTYPQYVYALLPEYGYKLASGNCVTLKNTAGAKTTWKFPSVGNVENVHYTPVWYPDGEYAIAVVQSDMWTPMGMLIGKIVNKDINISGNMYDDWYVGRK